MIVFAHTKFGLVWIKGSGVKREGWIPSPGLSKFLKSRMDRVNETAKSLKQFFQTSLVLEFCK